jgi:hypothetical protein
MESTRCSNQLNKGSIFIIVDDRSKERQQSIEKVWTIPFFTAVTNIAIMVGEKQNRLHGQGIFRDP